MWNQLIGSFATLGVVITLIAVIFKMKSKEIDTMKQDFKEELQHARQDFKEGIQDIRADFMEALKTLHEEKVNKETCDTKHESTNEKFDVLFGKVDTCIDKINNVSTDVKVIKKGVNGDV